MLTFARRLSALLQPPQVHPTAWKWPKNWPYNGDYFSRKTESSVELNGTPVLTPYYDAPAAAALAGHYKRYAPCTRAIVLERQEEQCCSWYPKAVEQNPQADV